MRQTIKFVPIQKAGLIINPEKEGIIEVRPGTKGIDLGECKFASAYIRVKDMYHYFKGMCIYSDNLPDGYDVIKYCRDPSDCLKALLNANEDDNLQGKVFNKGIMTKIKDNANWDAWAEEIKKHWMHPGLNRKNSTAPNEKE